MKKERKPPIIRKGQKKPFRRATNQEIQERTEYVAKLLVKLKTKMEIHKSIRTKFNIEWRQTDVYIAHAKKFLQLRSRMDKEEARSIGVNALLRVIAEGKPNEIVQAERRWSDIWGYNAPTIIRDNIRPQKEIIINNPKEAASVVLYLPEGRSGLYQEPQSTTEPKKP